MMELDQKARAAAINAANEIAVDGAPVPDYVDAILRAYLASLPSDDEVGRVCERLEKRAATMNGTLVGASDGGTYALGYYDQFAAADDKAAAALIQSQAAELAAVKAERDEARSIVRDIYWMAVRYADNRKSYAVGMCNDALRKAYDGGWLVYKDDKQHDLDPQYARDGMFDAEWRSAVDAATARAERAEAALAEANKARIETYYARQIEWSRKTFGPAIRTGGVLDHIRKELDEIEADPHDLSEWVDVIILAMDGFWRHGGTVDDLMPRLLAKQVKNMARTWPDWRTMSEDQAIEHDRSLDAARRAHSKDGGEHV